MKDNVFLKEKIDLVINRATELNISYDNISELYETEKLLESDLDLIISNMYVCEKDQVQFMLNSLPYGEYADSVRRIVKHRLPLLKSENLLLLEKDGIEYTSVYYNEYINKDDFLDRFFSYLDAPLKKNTQRYLAGLSLSINGKDDDYCYYESSFFGDIDDIRNWFSLGVRRKMQEVREREDWDTMNIALIKFSLEIAIDDIKTNEAIEVAKETLYRCVKKDYKY